MALLKCPDCGKMVSERAIACPDCGCPREFFCSTEEIAIKDAQKVEEVEEDDEFVIGNFCVLEHRTLYFKDNEAYLVAARVHANVVSGIDSEIRKIYKEGKNIDIVWDKIVPTVQYAIDKLVRENVGTLYSFNIVISEEEFKKKYSLTYFEYLKELAEKYDTIINKANQIQEAKEYERAGRSRWEGGGFGVKGAIKGAITAGAFNMVTGVGRAIGDSVVDSRDRATLNDQKVQLYEDKKVLESIIERMRICLHRVDIGMAEEMANGGYTETYPMDFLSARKELGAALNYEKDKKKLAKKAFEILQYYPFEMECYSIIIEEISHMPEELDELVKFIKFWNLEACFTELIKQIKNRDLIMGYIQNNECCQKINFNDYSPYTYKELKKIKSDMDELTGSKEFVMLVPFCCQMKKFFANCMDKPSCMNSLSVLDGIDESSSIDSIVYKIHEEKIFMPELLKNIWVKGDEQKVPEEKIKKKWNIPLSDTIYMYQNSAIFGTAFGGDGFFLTNSLVCDLKSKTIILLNEIQNVFLDEPGNGIEISDGVKKIFINLNGERKTTKNFLFVFLEELLVRCETLSEEQRHMLLVEKTAKRIEEIIDRYAKVNGVKDKSILLSEFLSKHNVIKKESEKIFCPYCGNKIMRNAKFCNFCGKSNNYSPK